MHKSTCSGLRKIRHRGSEKRGSRKRILHFTNIQGTTPSGDNNGNQMTLIEGPRPFVTAFKPIGSGSLEQLFGNIIHLQVFGFKETRKRRKDSVSVGLGAGLMETVGSRPLTVNDLRPSFIDFFSRTVIAHFRIAYLGICLVSRKGLRPRGSKLGSLKSCWLEAGNLVPPYLRTLLRHYCPHL